MSCGPSRSLLQAGAHSQPCFPGDRGRGCGQVQPQMKKEHPHFPPRWDSGTPGQINGATRATPQLLPVCASSSRLPSRLCLFCWPPTPVLDSPKQAMATPKEQSQLPRGHGLEDKRALLTPPGESVSGTWCVHMRGAGLEQAVGGVCSPLSEPRGTGGCGWGSVGGAPFTPAGGRCRSRRSRAGKPAPWGRGQRESENGTPALSPATRHPLYGRLWPYGREVPNKMVKSSRREAGFLGLSPRAWASCGVPHLGRSRTAAPANHAGGLARSRCQLSLHP